MGRLSTFPSTAAKVHFVAKPLPAVRLFHTVTVGRNRRLRAGITGCKGVFVRSSIVACAAVLVMGQPVRASDDTPPAPAWQVVWQDDFEGDALDRTRWSPEESCWGGGNNERQCYTDREKNIRVEDGALHLIAQRERYNGPLFPEGMKGAPGGRKTMGYTSGKVRTRGLADWTYGRISARIRLPEGLGTWPAFWMMPAGDAYGPWPLSGEIDIMEAVNLGAPCDDCRGGIENRTSGALHFGDLAPDNTYFFAKTNGLLEGTPADDWHVYTIEWAEGVIQWFVDGEILVVTNSLRSRDSVERRLGFDEVMARDFPSVVVLPSVEAHDDPGRMARIVTDVVARRESLVGIYSMGSGNTTLLDALRASPRSGRLVVIAHELTPATRQALIDGEIDAVIAQNVGHLIRSSLRVLRNLCDDLPIYEAQERLRIEVVLRENLP